MHCRQRLVDEIQHDKVDSGPQPMTFNTDSDVSSGIFELSDHSSPTSCVYISFVSRWILHCDVNRHVLAISSLVSTLQHKCFG